MDLLESRVEQAAADQDALNDLLTDYLPFIKKTAAGFTGSGLEYEDMVSIAMLVFMNCVYQYRPGKGGFLAFAKTSIKNRLIDEKRRELRSRAVIPLTEDTEEGETSAVDSVAIDHYDKEQERERLRDEIGSLSEGLEAFDITVMELARICPKQKRARLLCCQAARQIVGDERLRDTLFRQKRIPQGELSQSLHVSPKTIEKHRKYIVSLVVLLTGDYPGIRTFLPQMEEVET